jgi:hypothetical protein
MPSTLQAKVVFRKASFPHVSPSQKFDFSLRQWFSPQKFLRIFPNESAPFAPF